MLRIFTLSLAVLSLMAGIARGDDAGDALVVLGEPRTHAIMRHALAPGYSDPTGFEVTDCATQRNLNEDGRQQARKTGIALRDAGASFDAVWTSQWCRCIDTADLLNLGEGEQVAALNSFFEDRSTSGAQTAALIAKLEKLPPDETVMMVTHQVNISALLGRSTTSGEVVVFSFYGDGKLVERGSFVLPAR